MQYICTKFCEANLKGFTVIEQTLFSTSASLSESLECELRVSASLGSCSVGSSRKLATQSHTPKAAKEVILQSQYNKIKIQLAYHTVKILNIGTCMSEQTV